LLRVARLAYATVVYRHLRRSDYAAMGRVVIARRAQSTLLFAVLAALIVLEVSSLLILGAESASPDRNIKTAFDAVCWNIVTLGTVGYGDRYPVTTLGRIIGIVVIITGVALFSGITSFLAQWFLKPRAADDAAADKLVAAQVRVLRDELAQRDRSSFECIVSVERCGVSSAFRLSSTARLCAGCQSSDPALPAEFHSDLLHLCWSDSLHPVRMDGLRHVEVPQMGQRLAQRRFVYTRAESSRSRGHGCSRSTCAACSGKQSGREEVTGRLVEPPRNHQPLGDSLLFIPAVNGLR
jgi:hypothetical protein